MLLIFLFLSTQLTKRWWFLRAYLIPWHHLACDDSISNYDVMSRVRSYLLTNPVCFVPEQNLPLLVHAIALFDAHQVSSLSLSHMLSRVSLNWSNVVVLIFSCMESELGRGTSIGQILSSLYTFNCFESMALDYSKANGGSNEWFDSSAQSKQIIAAIHLAELEYVSMLTNLFATYSN